MRLRPEIEPWQTPSAIAALHDIYVQLFFDDAHIVLVTTIQILLGTYPVANTFAKQNTMISDLQAHPDQEPRIPFEAFALLESGNTEIAFPIFAFTAST